jgi:uncharacterized protein
MATFKIDLSRGTAVAQRGYIYSDLALDIHKADTEKDIAILKDVESIKNGIKNIFEWKKGERILLPDFGNDLESLVYEPINDLLIDRAKNLIINMLRWEPRITIEDIEIKWPEDTNQIEVNLSYSIPSLKITTNYQTRIGTQYIAQGEYIATT